MAKITDLTGIAEIARYTAWAYRAGVVARSVVAVAVAATVTAAVAYFAVRSMGIAACIEVAFHHCKDMALSGLYHLVVFLAVVGARASALARAGAAGGGGSGRAARLLGQWQRRKG